MLWNVVSDDIIVPLFVGHNIATFKNNGHGWHQSFNQLAKNFISK